MPSSNYTLSSFLFKPEDNAFTKSILLAHSKNLFKLHNVYYTGYVSHEFS